MTAGEIGLNAGTVAGSLVMLYVGAEWLVRGSALLARAAHIRPMVIGLTVVAFGTSTPELVVGLTSTLKGVSEIAIGNIVGANIANVGLIIGASALVRPLVVQRTTWRNEIPPAVAAQVLLLVFCLCGAVPRTIERWEGAVLMVVLVGFVVWMVLTARDTGAVLPEELTRAPARPLHNAVRMLVGLGLLVAGGNLLVPAAVKVAEAAGVSTLTIGLTVIAFGTTVPELATSTVAARRGEGDIAVGNAVGSILFNTTFVLGLAAVIRPIAIAAEEFRSLVWIELPLMILMVLALAPLMRSGFRVTRLEGAILVVIYVGFVAYSFWSGRM